jgi:hypothetical protein
MNPNRSTPAVEVENCDECGAIRPITDLWPIVNYGLLCESCTDELRNQGLHQ